MLEISLVGGIAFAALAGALLALAWLRRVRVGIARTRAGQGMGEAADPRLAAHPGPREEEQGSAARRRLELRLEALEARLAETLADGSPEDRLRDMAGSLIGLIRDKNATLETALAGLDQLRARLRALERVGEVAEARALFEELGNRLDALRADQAALAAETSERIAQLRARAEAEEAPRLALAEQLARLYDAREAGLVEVLGRLAPIEERLGGLAAEQAGDCAAEAEREARLEARIEALEMGRAAAEIALAALRAENAAGRAGLEAEREAEREAALGPVRAIAERLADLHAQKEALAEALLARVEAVEARLGALDPAATLARLAGELAHLRAEREAAEDMLGAGLDALGARIEARLGALEHPAADPFAALADQLAELAAQKEATVETVVALLAPLESRLAGTEAALAALPEPAPGAAEEAARAEARAIAQALVLERTALFADRLALLEASLPGPSGIHAPWFGQAAVPGLAEEAAPWGAAPPAGEVESGKAGSGEEAREADLAAIRSMRRIVSLRQE